MSTSLAKLSRVLTTACPTVDIPIFLVPFLYTQRRSASILSSLAENPAAQRNRKRLGRGPSSGKGKTSGRGHKGQNQHGKVPAGFNGGQTPLEVVHGKRGDHKFAFFAKDMTKLNLEKVQDWVSQGRIDPSKPITPRELIQSRCISRPKDGIKLLAKGANSLSQPLHIIISRASKSAIEAVEAAGGSIVTRYYTQFAMRKMVQGKMDPINSQRSRIELGEVTAGKNYVNRLPDPVKRRDIEYYRDPQRRGYLTYTIAEGETPSLYFKKPRAISVDGQNVQKAKHSAEENRIW